VFYFEGNDTRRFSARNGRVLATEYLKPDSEQGLSTRQHEIDRELLSYVEAVRGTSRWMQRLQHGRRLIRLKNFRALMASVLLIHKRRAGIIGEQPESFPHRSGAGDSECTVLGGTLVFVYLPEWKRYAHPILRGVTARSSCPRCGNLGFG